MSDCRNHGLGDCPQHATSGIGLLRRQLGELESEIGVLLGANARLTDENTWLKAECVALRTALEGIDLKLEVARLGLDRDGPQYRRIDEARKAIRAALADEEARKRRAAQRGGE